MLFKKASIYCFSGTGNTLIVSKALKQELESSGVDVKLFAMEKEDPKNIDLSGAIGLSFPVAVFTSYPLVMDFITKMPKAEGTPVFMFSTMGGAAAGMKSYLRSLLLKKGYRPVGAKQIVMPDNFTPTPAKDKINPDIVDKGTQTIRCFAKQLLSGSSKWGYFPLLPSLIFKLSQYIMRRPSFKKAVKINRNKCIKCGLCSKLCPVGNIVMREYPAFLDKCEVCMRCISYCPKGALYRKYDGEHVYRGVDVNEFLKGLNKSESA